MDYDGNDTQGHNLQLAGEGRSKSSSVLRPYAFPRFDFDDSLQGHLRFDSLVETEVFLGIQSQEDNQWIEDFSRGSNVIEFSSSATDSCSITRQNNVWSEATSSESVEMLLKSVGQDQIVPKDSVSENSNTCNELGDLTKKMEPKFEQDNVNGGHARISDSTMPQDELRNDFSGLKNRVEGKSSQVEEISLSQAHLVQKHESSSDMCPDVLEEECKAPVAEGDLLLGTECDDKNEEEVKCPVSESVDSIRDGVSQSALPDENISSSYRVLDSSQAADQLNSPSLEGTNVLIRVAGDGIKEQLALEKMGDADIQIMEQHKVEGALHTEEVPHSFTLSAESGDKGTGVEVTIKSNEFSALSCTQESQFQLLEERGRDNSLTSPSLPEKGQAELLSTNRVMIVAVAGDNSFTDNSEQHADKLDSLNAEQLSGSEPKMDSILQLDQELSSGKVTENSRKEGGSDGDVFGGCCRSSLVKGEDRRSTDKIGNANIVDVGELGFLVSSSSVELTRDTSRDESIKDLHDVSTVCVEGSNVLDGSGEDLEEEAKLRLSNASNSEDISVEVKKEENIRLHTDVIDMGSETSSVVITSDLKVRSSSMTKSTSHDETIVSQPHSEIAGETEPETSVIPCEENNDPVVGDNTEDMHKQPFGGESSHANVKEGSGAAMSMVVSLSTSNESDLVAAEVGGECEAQFGICHDSIVFHLSNTDGSLIPVVETCNAEGETVVETCNAAGESESHAANSSNCTEGLEPHPDCDNSPLNKDDVAEGVLSAADSQKVSCSSPTIISSDVPSPDERKRETVEVSDFAENKPSTSEEPKEKDISGDDNSFTFRVNSVPDVGRETTTNWAPFPIAENYKSSVVSEKVTTPEVDKIQAKLPGEAAGHSSGEHARGVQKTTSGRRRRVSGKGSAKENSQKGVNVQEATPDKNSQKGDKLLSVSSTPASSLPSQLAVMQPHRLTERKSKKLSTSTAVPASNLPDLNSSALKKPASLSTTFQQPFTDLQQVQLRAQIFVYGSLIQGTAPEETCMVSAFGSSDREKGLWEPLWRAAIERVRSKKSRSSGERPLHSHPSGVKVPDVAGRQVSPQSKVFPSPISRAGSQGTPTTVLNPIIPMPSPLWSISTPYHDGSQSSSLQRRPTLDYQPALSPLHPYQTPSVRNAIGHTTWPSQAPCSPSPWASQTSPLNVNARFSTMPIAETVKLNPVKDFSVAAPSCVNAVVSTPLASTGGLSTMFAGSSQLPDQTKGTLSSELPSKGNSQLPDRTKGTLSVELPSVDPKPRRRRKVQASNDIPQNPLVSQAQIGPIVASSLPTTAPLIPVTISTCHLTTSADVFPTCSISQPQVGLLDAGMASACTVETLQKVADAKLQAEEAAALSATAISHYQGLWNQLAKQASGMTQEAQVKIATAAGAAAAAASVAKAAAAAARVASNAALQAKLMVDEALVSSRAGAGAQSENLVSDKHGMGSATPTSILACDSGSNRSSSVLVAAREAAKRRIEAASAAAKQAENLDAIVKAAELAAEAVSQAGKIVAMGDPLPLKELINAGPEGHWKLPQAFSGLLLKSVNGNEDTINIGCSEGAEIYTKEYAGPSGAEGNKISDHEKILPGVLSNESFDVNAKSAHGISESTRVGEMDPSAGKGHKVSDLVQSNRGLPVFGKSSGSGIVQNNHEELGMVHGSNIKEGSAVEVYKDSDGIKPAWFSANVLALHEGKAFVCYTSLLSKEGSDNLKEWVVLEGEGDKAPRIRNDLPMIASHWQATRKRRRSVMGNNAWKVGDMVDVWIQDSWWEGVVTEKNEKDDTTLTIHFPARGETSAVSAEQLRPSRVWSDGNWVEWSRLRGHDRNENDMPRGKRPRLQSPLRTSKAKTKYLGEAEPVAGKPEESKLQDLSASEKVFNVGKSTKAEAKPDARRTLRTGLQKEGSRVVFGVPKPGKKRKFMEVSKHFPADQNREKNEAKDPVKFAKYLMPQGTASRGWKNPSKVDAKEKRAPKVTTSRKPRNASSRTVSQKDNLVNSASAQHDEALKLPGADVEKSVVHEENMSKLGALIDHRSSGTNEAPEGPLSSLFANQSDSFLKKSSLITKTEQLIKGEVVPSAGQLTKVDEEKEYDGGTDKAPAEVSERRRSIRRIQPTHRLLEGLQSSLIIPKMSSVSNDKGQGHKSRTRSALTRGK